MPAARKRARTSSLAGKTREPCVEWVQCDACNKWRTISPQIPRGKLPKSWTCCENWWNRELASCDAPEEQVEEVVVRPAPGRITRGSFKTIATVRKLTPEEKEKKKRAAASAGALGAIIPDQIRSKKGGRVILRKLGSEEKIMRLTRVAKGWGGDSVLAPTPARAAMASEKRNQLVAAARNARLQYKTQDKARQEKRLKRLHQHPSRSERYMADVGNLWLRNLRQTLKTRRGVMPRWLRRAYRKVGASLGVTKASDQRLRRYFDQHLKDPLRQAEERKEDIDSIAAGVKARTEAALNRPESRGRPSQLTDDILRTMIFYFSDPDGATYSGCAKFIKAKLHLPKRNGTFAVSTISRWARDHLAMRDLTEYIGRTASVGTRLVRMYFGMRQMTPWYGHHYGLTAPYPDAEPELMMVLPKLGQLTVHLDEVTFYFMKLFQKFHVLPGITIARHRSKWHRNHLPWVAFLFAIAENYEFVDTDGRVRKLGGILNYFSGYSKDEKKREHQEGLLKAKYSTVAQQEGFLRGLATAPEGEEDKRQPGSTTKSYSVGIDAYMFVVMVSQLAHVIIDQLKLCPVGQRPTIVLRVDNHRIHFAVAVRPVLYELFNVLQQKGWTFVYEFQPPNSPNCNLGDLVVFHAMKTRYEALRRQERDAGFDDYEISENSKWDIIFNRVCTIVAQRQEKKVPRSNSSDELLACQYMNLVINKGMLEEDENFLKTTSTVEGQSVSVSLATYKECFMTFRRLQGENDKPWDHTKWPLGPKLPFFHLPQWLNEDACR